MFDEQGLDSRSLQLGEGLPGALATGRRAGLGGLRELDETLARVAVGEFPGGRTVDITTTFNGSIFNHSNRYQLITAMDYDQRAEPSEEDFFNGTASEPPFDSITIATLYAIGEAGTDVDGSWSIFPQYQVFWNLNHASKMDRGTELEELKVNFDTALVSGIANPTVRELTRTDANLAEQVRAWFAKTSSAGEFWTT